MGVNHLIFGRVTSVLSRLLLQSNSLSCPMDWFEWPYRCTVVPFTMLYPVYVKVSKAVSVLRYQGFPFPVVSTVSRVGN